MIYIMLTPPPNSILLGRGSRSLGPRKKLTLLGVNTIREVASDDVFSKKDKENKAFRADLEKVNTIRELKSKSGPQEKVNTIRG